MSSPIPPTDSSSEGDENSNSSNTPSDTSDTSAPIAPSSTPLDSAPPLQEAQNSSPSNGSDSNSNLNSGANVQAPSLPLPPAPEGQENTQILLTPSDSNSSLNNESPPDQQPEEIPKSLLPNLSQETSNPSTPIAPNASSFSSSISFPSADPTPDPDLNSNSNSNAPTTPSEVVPTTEPTQSKIIINPSSPSQTIGVNSSNPVPTFQPEIHFNPPPPANQTSRNQTGTAAGVLPTVQVNSESDNFSPYSKFQKSSSPNRMNWDIGPMFIIVGAVSVLVAVIYFVGKKKKKLDDLVLDYGQPAKSDGVVYQQSFHYTGNSQTDNFYGPPRISTSTRTFSGNQQGLNNGSYQNGYYPGTQNNTTGSKSCFSYEEIMEMTGGFSREHLLGEGGFGCVYQGWLADGRCVAVKQLKVGSGQGEREFQAEVEIISRIHHRHLVSLVGYCLVEHHRMLVYEFVPNGTLEYHLHGRGAPVMEWGKRLRIAIGSARGLTYLHEDCHPRIIHRDVKSANILLDYAFEAQVADFGLAKFTSDTQTHVSTRVMGTFGYLAPEYASSGKLTDRSDVFSYGVVLLELITGRKPVEEDQSLVEWARPLLVQALETGNIDELVDPRLENYYNRDEMFRMIEAAAACVRHSAPKRPRMIQVLRALDNDAAHVMDLTNGVKVGQSTTFDANQSSASELQRFQQMVLSIEEELCKDGDASNKPPTRSVEPNSSVRGVSRR